MITAEIVRDLSLEVRFVLRSRKQTMDPKTLAVIVTIAFSVVGVCGDYFLKLASREENSLRTPWFYIGFTLYAATAFGTRSRLEIRGVG